MKIAEFQKIGEAIETFRIAMNENAGKTKTETVEYLMILFFRFSLR